MTDKAQTSAQRSGHGSRNTIRRVGIGGALFLGTVTLSGLAFAQDVDNTPLAYVDIDTGLRYETNRPGEDEFSFDTRLGAGLYTATSSQRLSIEGEILFQTLADEPVLTDPSASLSYAVFNRSTEIAVDLSYLARDLDDVVIDEDAFDADDLTEDGGRRERIEARLGLVTGRDAPFGTETVLSYRDDIFSDGATEDDETQISVSSTLRFTIDPRNTLRATGFASREDTDDGADTVETTHFYGLGADLLLDPAWTANLDIGFREIEIESGGMRTVTDGFVAGLLVTRDMPNGVLSFALDREVVTTGTEDTLRLRRALTLANGADVVVSLGAVIFEGADPITIYSASYANEIRPGSLLSLSLDRSGGVSDDDENIIRTRLAAGLDQDLTPASSLSFDAGLSQVEDASLTGADTRRIDLAVAYRHALTPDWNLAARAAHQILFEDGADDERSTVVSLGIERRFSFRP